MKPFRWNQRWSIVGAIVFIAIYALFPRGKPAPSGVQIVRASAFEETTKTDPFVIYHGTDAGFHRFSAIDGRAFAVPAGDIEVPSPFSTFDATTLHFLIRDGKAGPPDASRVEEWTRQQRQRSSGPAIGPAPAK